MGGRQPGEMYPGMGDHLRPPYPPSSVPGSMGQPLPSTAPELYRMAGQQGIRHPFRPAGPPTSQPLTRPDLYGQPLHPGMEPPREQSAVSLKMHEEIAENNVCMLGPFHSQPGKMMSLFFDPFSVVYNIYSVYHFIFIG